MLNTLAMKEMQIKSTLQFHVTPVTLAIIKNTTITNVGEDVGKKEPYSAGENIC
jgi:hypothetical protein